jgi:HPt (histidine-containing phosphotransfer) domain-containing protein
MDEILDRWIPREKQITKNKENDRQDKLPDKDTDSLLPVIPNVDTAKGVAMVRGSLKAYKNILSMFCKDVDERLPKLQIMPKEDTLPAFIIQAHSLKSVTASIGAQEVSAKAAGLEAAGKNADLAFIREHLPEFTEQLAELVKNIRIAINSPP